MMRCQMPDVLLGHLASDVLLYHLPAELFQLGFVCPLAYICAANVMSSAYLRLFNFRPPICIPSSVSSNDTGLSHYFFGIQIKQFW